MDFLGLLICCYWHIHETKTVESISVAICPRLTHYFPQYSYPKKKGPSLEQRTSGADDQLNKRKNQRRCRSGAGVLDLLPVIGPTFFVQEDGILFPFFVGLLLDYRLHTKYLKNVIPASWSLWVVWCSFCLWMYKKLWSQVKRVRTIPHQTSECGKQNNFCVGILSLQYTYQLFGDDTCHFDAFWNENNHLMLKAKANLINYQDVLHENRLHCGQYFISIT